MNNWKPHILKDGIEYYLVEKRYHPKINKECT